MVEFWFFSSISCFWGIRVRQKYAVWILIGCRIKFCIQWALLIEIWVKTQGDMSKIRTKKVVFFLTNMPIQPLWLTHFIEILLVLDFQSTKFIVGMFSYKSHFRPQISSNGLLHRWQLHLQFSFLWATWVLGHLWMQLWNLSFLI